MNKFLIDENLSPSIAQYLQELGYNAVSVREVGLKGKPDLEIITFAKRNKLIIFTQDIKFGNFFYFFPEESPGIIVLSGVKNTLSEQKGIIGYLHKNEIIKDPHLVLSLIIAQPGRYRLRRKK